MKITAPGIYKDFDETAYFADPAPQPSLSQSLAKVLIATENEPEKRAKILYRNAARLMRLES